MATITTFSELVTAISKWFLNRDMSADTDEIIDLAEAYLNTKLRLRQMESIDEITPADNVYDLPTDYLEYKRVTELASTRRPLKYIGEDAVDRMYPDRADGLSCHFTIVGDSIYTYPLSDNLIELVYYAKVPALSASNTTNWLLTAHPGLYLHTCLMYAAELTANEDGILQKEMTIVRDMIDNLHELDNRGKFAKAGVVLPGTVW